MTLLLRKPDDLPDEKAYEYWFGVDYYDNPVPDYSRQLPGLASWLERAFLESQDEWSEIGRKLQHQPTGDLAHMPTCGSFGSDFGTMLAWTRICKELANRPETTLMICGDPWLFRHLTNIPEIEAGGPPLLLLKSIWLHFRGVIARVKLAARLSFAYLRLRSSRRRLSPGDITLLVYAHPESKSDGTDTYFGSLMNEVPSVHRVLHTDAGLTAAIRLMKDSRTVSLHAWGELKTLLCIPLVKWRPNIHIEKGSWKWLILRSSMIENSGGGPAINLWQRLCQQNFLSDILPSKVCWPWENHGWERNLCRAARAKNIFTIGYQHTVVGPHQFNYAISTNADRHESIPDLVVCNGSAYQKDLIEGGFPIGRLRILGAFRYSPPKQKIFNLEGVVFVPLSAIHEAAHAQLEAATCLAKLGTNVVVKAHPMYPFNFTESENLKRTEVPLREQRSVRLVLVTTGASGFEAALAGIPVVRLQTSKFISIDVMPRELSIPTVTLETMTDLIHKKFTPLDIYWKDMLQLPDIGGWRNLICSDNTIINTGSTEQQTAPKI